MCDEYAFLILLCSSLTAISSRCDVRLVFLMGDVSYRMRLLGQSRAKLADNKAQLLMKEALD